MKKPLPSDLGYQGRWAQQSAGQGLVGRVGMILGCRQKDGQRGVSLVSLKARSPSELAPPTPHLQGYLPRDLYQLDSR